MDTDSSEAHKYPNSMEEGNNQPTAFVYMETEQKDFTFYPLPVCLSFLTLKYQ